MKPCPVLSYGFAPPGSPDKYRLTQDAVYEWTGCPKWIWDIVSRRCVWLDSGWIVAYTLKGKRTIKACIFKGFFFSISVAYNFKRATPAGGIHDWLYNNAEALAAAWGCTVSDVLHLADHWFLAIMSFTGFLMRDAYFMGVRFFGYAFHQLMKKVSSP